MIITICIVSAIFILIAVAAWLEDSNKQINNDYIKENWLEMQDKYK